MPDGQLASNLKDLLEIRSLHDDEIFTASRRRGSAVGYKISGGMIDRTKPAIIVFVPKKASLGIVPPKLQVPPTFEANGKWCFTDVIETDRPGDPNVGAVPLTAANESLVAELAGGNIGIVGGIRIVCGADKNIGTAACVIKFNDTGKLGLLTNRHVARLPKAKAFHPGPDEFQIGSVRESFLEVEDQVRFPGVIDDVNSTYQADCASIMLLDHTKVAVRSGVHGIGKLSEPPALDLNSMSPIGMGVISVGCRRGLQRGTIFGFGYRYTDVPKHGHADFLILSDDQTKFTEPGDSGKLVIAADGHNSPIGLLWGGEPLSIRKGNSMDSIAYATDINWVLQLLKASIYQVDDPLIA